MVLGFVLFWFFSPLSYFSSSLWPPATLFRSTEKATGHDDTCESLGKHQQEGYVALSDLVLKGLCSFVCFYFLLFVLLARHPF